MNLDPDLIASVDTEPDKKEERKKVNSCFEEFFGGLES
jgi:hypothetical protein